jgi:hypothetical protein
MVANTLVGAALAVVVLSLFDEGKSLRKSAKQRVLWKTVWRGMSWRHVLPAPLVLGAAAAIGYLLNAHVGGLMNWGWWSAMGGQGNVVLGNNEQLFGVTGSHWVGRVMLVVVATLMPNLVTWEERLFRRGIERKTSLGRMAWSLAFGLFHLVAGLPLYAALALTVLGIYCSHSYMRTFRALEGTKGTALARRAAVLESTRAHLGFNALGVIVAALTVVS